MNEQMDEEVYENILHCLYRSMWDIIVKLLSQIVQYAS
jgi:hypothetical protein